MTPAEKTANARGLTSILSFSGLFFFTWIYGVAYDRWPSFDQMFLIPLAIALVGCAAIFFMSMCRWRARCPKCRDGIAKFTYNKTDDEYLTCKSCGYTEETDWTLGE
ncbi:hypothetical protein MFFC18_18570 [Mariniblastus fucicola]|uniref:Uncharacterized protein n=1 Tax=Mariniblastus fucicola TaxID=980251 RepID=A0A5B9PBX2_9BACT|nr:hypothetical protein MFFC18_18570 [Mariniblastus fucicola]